MGLIGSFNTSKRSFPWKELVDSEQLHEVIANSTKRLVLIFKHSTRCSISDMVLHRFEKEWDTTQESFELYYLDLLLHRDVSDEIATLTGVTHQSPQVIILHHKKAIYTASHTLISPKTFLKELNTFNE